MFDRDARSVTEAVLRVLDPEELPDLSEVWEEYWEHPVHPSDLLERDRVLGSGLAGAVTEWAPLVVAFVGTEVLAGAAVDAAKDGLRKGSARAWAKVRGRAGRAEGRVVFAEDQLAAVGDAARAAALAAGRSEPDADAFAEAVQAALGDG